MNIKLFSSSAVVSISALLFSVMPVTSETQASRAPDFPGAYFCTIEGDGDRIPDVAGLFIINRDRTFTIADHSQFGLGTGVNTLNTNIFGAWRKTGRRSLTATGINLDATNPDLNGPHGEPSEISKVTFESQLSPDGMSLRSQVISEGFAYQLGQDIPDVLGGEGELEAMVDVSCKRIVP